MKIQGKGEEALGETNPADALLSELAFRTLRPYICVVSASQPMVLGYGRLSKLMQYVTR